MSGMFFLGICTGIAIERYKIGEKKVREPLINRMHRRIIYKQVNWKIDN